MNTVHIIKKMQCVLIISIMMFLVGCATTTLKKGSSEFPDPTPERIETRQDVIEAIGAVTDAVTNPQRKAKYCPICGRHYSHRLEVCPVDSTPLNEIEE